MVVIRINLTVLLLNLFTAFPAQALEYDVLLDASGSMLGFHAAGLENARRSNCKSRTPAIPGSAWKEFIGSMTGGDNKGARCLFGDTYLCYEGTSLANFCLRDQNTDLSGSLSTWRDNFLKNGQLQKRLVIITDNVADTANENSRRNQLEFTKILSGRDSVFTHRAVITLRLPFNGALYSLTKKGKTSYTGKRALVLYVLGIKGISTQEFVGFRDLVENKIRIAVDTDYKLYQVQPFSTASVKQKYGNIKITSDNKSDVRVRPEKNNKNETVLVISNYTLGSDLSFSFETSLGIQGAFLLNGIDLKSVIQFEDLPNQIIRKGQNTKEMLFQAKVSPSNVTLRPDRSQLFKIDFHIGRLSLADMPFGKKLGYALTNTQDLKGQLDLEFKIKRDNYEPFKQSFVNWTHSARNELANPEENVQGKVYQLEDILQSGVAEDTTDENLKSIPVILKVQYNMGPLISALLLCSVILGVFYWVWLKARKNQDYFLEDDMGGSTPLSIGLGQAYKHYDDLHRHLFTLRFLGFSYFVTSRLKLRGSRFLSSGQSFEIYDGETQQSFYLSQKNSDSSYTDDSYDW